MKKVSLGALFVTLTFTSSVSSYAGDLTWYELPNELVNLIAGELSPEDFSKFYRLDQRNLKVTQKMKHDLKIRLQREKEHIAVQKADLDKEGFSNSARKVFSLGNVGPLPPSLKALQQQRDGHNEGEKYTFYPLIKIQDLLEDQIEVISVERLDAKLLKSFNPGVPETNNAFLVTIRFVDGSNAFIDLLLNDSEIQGIEAISELKEFLDSEESNPVLVPRELPQFFKLLESKLIHQDVYIWNNKSAKMFEEEYPQHFGVTRAPTESVPRPKSRSFRTVKEILSEPVLGPVPSEQNNTIAQVGQ